MSNLWQDSLWEKFQKAVGRKVHEFRVDGATALVIQHKLPFKFTYFDIPRGPIFDNEAALKRLFVEIKKTAKQERVLFVRMSSYQEINLYNLVATEFDHHPETTLLIDLNLSEEGILAQMKPKGRYNIKVAKKNGVTVRAEEDLDAFYDILTKTGGRDGFGIHPKDYYKKMLSSLGDNVQLLLARQNGEVVAGGIFVYLNDTAIYYYGASDHEKRNLMAPYLVQWSAIKEAKKRGCKTYDFLGIAPEGIKYHPWVGVTEFKKKFGGKVVNYPHAQDMVFHPLIYLVYKVYKMSRKN